MIRGRPLIAALPFVAALSAAPRAPAAPAPGAVSTAARRVTLHLDQATLAEAAARVAEATGMPLRLSGPGGDEPGDEDPAPDPTRRASLDLREMPVPDALRAFCRAFDCVLTALPAGGCLVAAGPYPSGPVIRTPELEISLDEVSFDDLRTQQEPGEEVDVNRDLTLHLSLRVPGGDGARVRGVRRLRVVDQAGRDRLLSVPAPAVGVRVRPGPFSDTRHAEISLTWPYPTPQRLRLIEGETVLFGGATRLVVDLPVPTAGAVPVELGWGTGQLALREPGSGRFGATLSLTHPAGIALSLPGPEEPATMLLPGGTRVPLFAFLHSTPSGGELRTTMTLGSEAPFPAAPERLRLVVVLGSPPERSVPFRFQEVTTGFPAEPAPPRPAARPVPPRKTRP